jgi:transcriptional regulator with XRE-family HTH domain
MLSASQKSLVLSGKRNLSISVAKRIAEATGTDPIVWVDPERVNERRAAWESYEKKKTPAETCRCSRITKRHKKCPECGAVIFWVEKEG